MITQTSLQQTIIPTAGAETPQRIIVLVPDDEIDLAYAANKIWEIAVTANRGIQFIGLCANAYREPGLRRQLVTLSALLENEKLPVRSRVEIGSDWLSALRSEWREGDIVVCFAGVSAGFSRRPLSQILESNVKATIYVIGGLPRQVHRSRSGWWSDALAWFGSLAIILGLFWIQTIITDLPTEWARTLFLCISVLVGFGMMWIWNNLFS